LYADSVFGVWPDTTENFSAGVIGIPYEQILNLIVPSDAGLVDPQFAGLVIDSVGFVGITGLPLGLSVACNSQTPAACTYITGQLGCGVITGTPTETGTFPLVLNVLAHSSIFGNVLSVPYTFGGYQIVITDNTTSIEGPELTSLGSVRTVRRAVVVRRRVHLQTGIGQEDPDRSHGHPSLNRLDTIIRPPSCVHARVGVFRS
jgi:hypothetical protein